MTSKPVRFAAEPTRAARLTAELDVLRPRTRDELGRFVQRALGLRVPAVALEPGSSPPLDYLSWTFFEHERDAVVWASRGGGKTLLGAVATLLDLLFKPGIQVRILGGSLEQSSRMFEHLRQLCDRPGLRGLLAGQPTRRRVELINGSRAAVLAQSQRSIRGVRVHKLRCDEVEEFDPEVWEAAQLVTRSGWCGSTYVRGRVEAMSTMHRPGGLMSRLISRRTGAKVFRWNYLDVIERCPPGRDCRSCPLHSECRGRAREAAGFLAIDDLVQQWHRTSRDTWAAEMRCRRPRRGDRVYPGFDPRTHVRPAGSDKSGALVGGMDFGLRSPLVMLWARLDCLSGEQVVHVVEEYIEPGRTMAQHLTAIDVRTREAGLPRPAWLGVDPAGRQGNSHSGLSDIDLLRAEGYRVRSRPSRLAEGIELLRCRFDRGTLLVDPRCTRLIEALEQYHFDPRRPQREQPVKDGPDHLCDALRYLVINLESGASPVRVARYA
ncbi:MAG: hypothetical protein ACOCTI_03870 [Phycisphaeraceae bacterium]